MKNRFFKGTLILLVLLTCGILIKADSQIQKPPKLKVAVYVQCDNQVHQTQVEGAIKRELRSFGDVQIVGSDISNGLWDYRIVVHLLGIESTHGSIHQYASSMHFYVKVPIEHFALRWQESYIKYPAIHIPTGQTGYVGINKLEDMGKNAATKFDKDHLQPIRDMVTRLSR